MLLTYIDDMSSDLPLTASLAGVHFYRLIQIDFDIVVCDAKLN